MSAANKESLVGQTLGEFQLTTKLGFGVSGAVYNAQKTDIDTQFAIKIFNPTTGEGKEEEKNIFRKEAGRLEKLHHRNVVPYRGSGIALIEGEERPYIVMLRANKGSLEDTIRKPSIPRLEIAVDYIDQAASGLLFVHKKGIVHQDVKLANLLVNEEDIWLADFGVAGSAFRKGLVAKGTLAHTAPEKFDNVVQQSGDLYALGVSAYRLLTGRFPFMVTDEEIKEIHKELEQKLGRSISLGDAKTVAWSRAHASEIPLFNEKWDIRWIPDTESLDLREALQTEVQRAMAKKSKNRQTDVDEFRQNIKVIYHEGLSKMKKMPKHIDVKAANSNSSERTETLEEIKIYLLGIDQRLMETFIDTESALNDIPTQIIGKRNELLTQLLAHAQHDAAKEQVEEILRRMASLKIIPHPDIPKDVLVHPKEESVTPAPVVEPEVIPAPIQPETPKQESNPEPAPILPTPEPAPATSSTPAPVRAPVPRPVEPTPPRRSTNDELKRKREEEARKRKEAEERQEKRKKRLKATTIIAAFAAGISIDFALAGNENGGTKKPNTSHSTEYKPTQTASSKPTPTKEKPSPTPTPTTEKPRIPSEGEKLASQEQTNWQNFLGKEIQVPSAPQKLLDTMKLANEKGITNLEPHYLPSLSLSQNDNYPGWKNPLPSNFWDYSSGSDILAQNGVSGHVDTSVTNEWVLIDTTRLSNSGYDHDPINSIIQNAKDSGATSAGNFYKNSSRFDLTAHEVENIILPQIAQKLHLPKSQVTLPKAAAYCTLANIYYPSWLMTEPNYEWFADKLSNKEYQQTLQTYGNGNNINYIESNQYSESTGFRYIISFSYSS